MGVERGDLPVHGPVERDGGAPYHQRRFSSPSFARMHSRVGLIQQLLGQSGAQEIFLRLHTVLACYSRPLCALLDKQIVVRPDKVRIDDDQIGVAPLPVCQHDARRLAGIIVCNAADWGREVELCAVQLCNVYERLGHLVEAAFRIPLPSSANTSLATLKVRVTYDALACLGPLQETAGQ